MHIRIERNVRLYVDVEGAGLVPDGPAMRDKPTLVLLHGGPGYDHTSFKPAFSQLADIAQIVYYDHRGHGRSAIWRAIRATLARSSCPAHRPVSASSASLRCLNSLAGQRRARWRG